MKGVSRDSQLGHLFIRNRFSGGVVRLIHLGADGQAFAGLRMTNQVDHGQIVDQGTGPPVFRDVAKHPVLNLVPLAGAGRKVPHMDGQAQLVAELLEHDFPEPNPRSVAAPAVSRDQ